MHEHQIEPYFKVLCIHACLPAESGHVTVHASASCLPAGGCWAIGHVPWSS